MSMKSDVYKVMWNEHKDWLKKGVGYYTEILNCFDDVEGSEYARISNIAQMFQTQLERVKDDERLHKTQIKEYKEE